MEYDDLVLLLWMERGTINHIDIYVACHDGEVRWAPNAAVNCKRQAQQLYVLTLFLITVLTLLITRIRVYAER